MTEKTRRKSAWRRWTRPVRHAAVGGLLNGLSSLFRRLPRPVSLALGAEVGGVAMRIARGSRRICERNLMEILGVNPPLARIMTRRVFRQAGRNAVDGLSHSFRPDDLDRDLEFPLGDIELVHRAHAKGGVIVLCPHLGSWELLGAAFVRQGLPLVVPFRTAGNPRVAAFLARRRTEAGVEIVDRSGSLAGLEARLNAKGVVGLMSDQDTTVRSVVVPFMGRDAHTPVGPARLALETGSAVFVVSDFMDESGRHRAKVTPVPYEGRYPDDVARITLEFNEALAEAIARAPDQWVWFHRRWRFEDGGRGEDPLASGVGSERGGTRTRGPLSHESPASDAATARRNAGTFAGEAGTPPRTNGARIVDTPSGQSHRIPASRPEGRGTRDCHSVRPRFQGGGFPRILGTLLLFAGCENGTHEELAPPRPTSAVQRIEGFTLQSTRAGQAQWVLGSRSADVYDRGRAELNGVRLSFLDSLGDTTSTITALEGTVGEAGRRLIARGDVLAMNSAGARLRSDSLVYRPETERITTDGPVEIQREGGVVRGVGLDMAPDMSDIVIRSAASGLMEDPSLDEF